jgi:hypothetical protein
MMICVERMARLPGGGCITQESKINSPTLPLSLHNSKALIAGFSKYPDIFLLNLANELKAVSISGPSHLSVNKIRYCDSQMSLCDCQCNL